MKNRSWAGIAIAGACAGMVTGLFGAGGGLVLVPLLSLLTDMEENRIFASSITIILPICAVCLAVTALTVGLPMKTALPYLLGSAVGGLFAGLWGRKVPALWLHRCLGIFILWGGYRYLCQNP